MPITRQDLRKIARARLKDSEVLFERSRYDGAIYLCGLAVEIALKARVCRVLGWATFPENTKEFNNFGLIDIKTHDFVKLAKLCAIEHRIAADVDRDTDWKQVATWRIELRYRHRGLASRGEAQKMLAATQNLVAFILGRTK